MGGYGKRSKEVSMVERRRQHGDGLEYPGPIREPMRLASDGVDGHGGGSVSRLLSRMRASAFQGRKLGEAFDAWKAMIDGPSLIALGLAGSMSSAGLWPLVTWLVERGYVDLLVSTSANATEDLLEQRGVAFYRVDPDHVDDRELWGKGFYRFYDHVASAVEYDRMEDFTAGFFAHLAATCARHRVPLFVPAAPDGPIAEGYRTARRKGPVVDFFADVTIALPLLCQGLLEHYGPGHVRPARAAIAAEVAPFLAG